MEANLNDQSKDMKLLINMITSMSTNNKQTHDIRSIHPRDLKDPEPKDAEKRGKVIKKLYKFQSVACKPYTDDEYKGEHFRTRLAILGKLYTSNNIIKFI